MAKRPKSKIQRGFVLGYLAVAVMVVATGFVLKYIPSISADITGNWSAMSTGINGNVYASTISGTNLIAGGAFTTAGGVTTNHIAQWNGSSWSALGSGTNGNVSAVAVYNNKIIAGGAFTTAGGVTTNNIAQWNGSSWSAIGSGINGIVYALTVYNGNLIAGGNFTTAGGVTTNHIAQWNGSSWVALGSGMGGANALNVTALTVYNGKLIAGGHFLTAGGVSANNIAQWNGSSWSALGSGMNQMLLSLTVSGTNLIAGGVFTTAGGISANSIAQWNGSSWSALGTGADGNVSAITFYDNKIIAGGTFTTASGVSTSRIAKWNGSSWSALGSGTNDYISTLIIYNGNLIAGGAFTTAGVVSANHIAQIAFTTPTPTTPTPTPSTTATSALKTLHYTATVDGNATIQFSGTTAKVISSDYKGVTGATVTGDLTGCTSAALAGDMTQRVALTAFDTKISPFTVKVRDNGSGSFAYSFDLYCINPIPAGVSTLKQIQYSANIDANATIQFSGKTATVTSADYKGVTSATTVGDLTGCTNVALSGDSTGRVSLTSSVSPFTVKVRDNGSGSYGYNFHLYCTAPLGTTGTQTPTPTTSATTSKTAIPTSTPVPTATPKPVAPSCMVGSTATSVPLNDRDKELFGSNAKGYLVKTKDGQNFRIVVGGTKLSTSGAGGQVQLVYGFQNLNLLAVGDSTFGYLKYIYKTDGKATNATIDFRNQSVKPADFFKGTKTITVSDFSQAVPNLQMLKSTTTIACITDPIKLASLPSSTSPTPTSSLTPSPSLTPTSSLTPSPSPTVSTSPQGETGYTFKRGFNTIVAPNNTVTEDSRVLDSAYITGMNMYVYDFNRLGQNNWRTTHPYAGVNFGLIPQLFNQIGYYIYNPGPELTVKIPVITKGGPSSNEEKTKMRKGWNLLAVSSDTAQKLSEYKLYVTKKGAAANCSDDSCIEQVTLNDLLTGDSTTRRAYRTIYEIKDGTATSADNAFTVVKVDSTNIDSITIPAKMPFWIYLWD